MQRKLSSGMVALLTTIACFLLSGSVFAVYTTVLRPGIFNTQATAVANNFLKGRVQATLQATKQALASATAIQNLYLQTVNTQPIYSDSLSESQNGDWSSSPSSTSGCTFKESAYHVFEFVSNFTDYCLAPAGALVNFALQVRMSLIKGDEAGIVFGLDGTTNADYFGIDPSGGFVLYNVSNQQLHILTHAFNQVINANLNHPNLLTLIVRNNIIYLYVNSQYVGGVGNPSYKTSGYAGLFVEDSFSPTDAAFNNVQIWKL
jgi:hypothetical protein